MKSAVGSKHSLHYVAVSTQPGTRIRLLCDVAQGIGIQKITVTHGRLTGPADVIVYRKIVFLRGNAFTMRVFFGFSPKQANTFAGQWIFIPHSSPAFAPIADGATFQSFVASLFPPNQLSLVTAGKLVGVRGTGQHEGVTVDETVFAPDRGSPLPVKKTASYPGHVGTNRLTMSHWNKAVQVSVPANAVPIAVVTGG